MYACVRMSVCVRERAPMFVLAIFIRTILLFLPTVCGNYRLKSNIKYSNNKNTKRQMKFLEHLISKSGLGEVGTLSTLGKQVKTASNILNQCPRQRDET